jgi:2,3-bisphosphoglycerate-independent phosphoglycerate mutase
LKKYVVIVPDGAADLVRIGGRTLLQLARIPYMDRLAELGVSGLMQTLYDELPKGSIVAQLGMLGYDPFKYYPGGRASCEALALGVNLDETDICFRANFVFMKGEVLNSYNADYIKSEVAQPLVAFLSERLAAEFPEFELYHNSDFRNTLVMRGAKVSPGDLICPEPHENMGNLFDIANLVGATNGATAAVARRINEYLKAARELLEGQPANSLFPWSASSALSLPPFGKINRFQGNGVMIGHMDFLHGIAKASGLEFLKMGNGNWNTDYVGKGEQVLAQLENGYTFVYCHINAPDESSHMGDIERKVCSIEQIDEHVVGPVYQYFRRRLDELGGVIVAPDHYTNHFPRKDDIRRSETHSAHPVPFLFWNGRDRDENCFFSAADVLAGKNGREPISHTDLLKLFCWF